jgi:enamine deaminase RidA (YjgF/YER057c/UK114 family)
MNQRAGIKLVSGANPTTDPHSAEFVYCKKEALISDRRSLHASQVMCEAYHYLKPSAFSRGMEVDLGPSRLILVSGTASVGPNGETLYVGDFDAQAHRAFENARAVLNNAGANWQDVVKTTIFLKDIAAYYAAFNKARSSYFREIGLEVYPASTCVEARLCRDELLVEMELIAVVRNNC